MLRAIFLGRKNIATHALLYLIRNNWDVLIVIPRKKEPDWLKKPNFGEFVLQNSFQHVYQKDILDYLNNESENELVKTFLEKPVDYVFSYLFPELIKKPLLDLPSKGAINFHPGALPKYAGIGGYNLAILNNELFYGVTAHFMDEHFDTGDIIEIKYFPIDSEKDTALDIELRGHPVMLKLFEQIIDTIHDNKELNRISQHDQTMYNNRKYIEALKNVDVNDTKEKIEKQTRAFWYPPYDGATIEIDGEKFTLIPKRILTQLGDQNENLISRG